MRRNRRWTSADIQQLRELAATLPSDHAIAAVMHCRPSAVSWKRRLQRIKIEAKKQRVKHAKPVVAPGKTYEPGHRIERIERMMELAGMM